MNALDVRRAVEATVSPLSDIARAGVWQRVEQELESPPAGASSSWSRAAVWGRVHPLRLRVAILSLAAVAVLAIVAVISLRADSPSRASSSHGTALVFDAGVHSQRWESDVLAIHGPAELRLERHLLV
ncbi:MAG TPA: hypothetical protein VM261_14190, partial [Kofleriaceae bacterium]|nr:hypothetical protein [Kofleriaceae bacterium]